MVRVDKESPGFSHPLCSVVDVLGDPNAPGNDVLAIIRRYDLPVEFPADVLEEAEQARADLTPEVIASRLDLRDTITVTIDPVDARDFDDAISIRRIDKGGFELGVHIADVAHYVTVGSAMDNEAVERGMSCYFVDRVIPMLPERLSNDLCSLRPDVDRLTKSAIMRLDKEGNILSSDFADTVIHSNARLHYGQVQSYLDRSTDNNAGDIAPDVGGCLKLLSKLTDVLIAQRVKRAGLDLDLPEAKIVLDKEGKPVDIVKRDRFMAHRMVEEAMILANTLTAERLQSLEASFLYRVHDRPDDTKLAAFGEVATLFGYDFKVSHIHMEGYMKSFLESLRGTKHERLLNMLLLRSTKKALYSPKNNGHYGLGLATYSHFTSPIRRYPDLVMHRAIEAYITNKDSGNDRVAVSGMSDLGIRISKRQLVIDSAERDSLKMKTAEFMHDHLGEEYDGTISGMMPFGFFVELDRYFAEGLIHVSSLDDDYYDIDSTGFALVGKRSGNRFFPGDRVRIIVARADKDRGEVDFMLVNRLKG